MERNNLSMRMSMRRFTRLTNGFSKKAENHAAAVALYTMWQNFGRPHKSIANPVSAHAGNGSGSSGSHLDVRGNRGAAGLASAFAVAISVLVSVLIGLSRLVLSVGHVDNADTFHSASVIDAALSTREVVLLCDIGITNLCLAHKS